MNLETVSVLAEWISTIAVVVSLLYLARQIHISNIQSQAAARYSFLDAYAQVNAVMASSKDAASVFFRGLEEKQLDEAERGQFLVQLGQFLNIWIVMFDLHREKQLPASQWVVVKSDLLVCFSAKGGYRFWQEVGRHNGSPEFTQWVDALLASNEKPYPFLAHVNQENQQSTDHELKN